MERNILANRSLEQSRSTGKMWGAFRFSDRQKLFGAVLAVQLCFSGFHIFTRAALNMGFSKWVFAVYRNAIALIFLAPFAYFLEKKDRPPPTFSLLFQHFLIGLCGITANQGFYLLGLHHLSPTYVSAIQNSTPAITFALAAALRLEQVNLRSRSGVAKAVGTLVSVGGATVITLYKGPPLFGVKPHSILGATLSSQIMDWTLGCLCILLNCLCWSGWLVLQVPVLRQYPARLSSIALTCLFGLIQLFSIAVFMEPNVEKWKFHALGELLAVLYSGLVASGIAFSLQTWSVDRGGPLFVSVFQPVQTVLVAAMAFLFFGDQLYSGGLAGSILIILGLYCVLWGKNEETKGEKLGAQGLTSHLLDQESSEKHIP